MKKAQKPQYIFYNKYNFPYEHGSMNIEWHPKDFMKHLHYFKCKYKQHCWLNVITWIKIKVWY